MSKRKIYTLPKGTELTGKLVKKIIDDHQADVEKYTQLESYISDDTPIMTRKAPNDIPVINDFGGYIVKINAGFLLGTPVEYLATKGVNIEPVLDLYRNQTIADLDAELAEDTATFGRAFENVYVDEESTVVSARLDPKNTIVVYDNTVKHKKMFAITYTTQVDDDGQAISGKYDVTVYDAALTRYYKFDGESLTDDETQPDEKHFFGDVPVVEYANNRRFQADHEPVLSGIDAYNILQGARVIDREKLVDAILAFYGVTLTPEDMEEIKRNRAVGLPPDSNAEYIIKNINEGDAETLRNALKEDIHKFSMTPDLSDKEFAGNSSGVALLYKLLAFEQNIKTKERYFERGLMERFRLYNNLLTIKSKMKRVEMKDVDATFKRNLPKNDVEASQMINNLVGIVDKETLVGQLSFVRDAKETVALAAAEEEPAADDFNKAGFGKAEPDETGNLNQNSEDDTDD
jgi:SPP1 family phage portal protein